ncbi:MAG: cob(I)yrinic acid a,c-diamide adenosyltransferase [Candidatus Daviesbacteria bacterium]|nr:cob(I)yrinic acid a,c-diamide adenosyltransferase [Candidatus Daviesbacteria bacterium]
MNEDHGLIIVYTGEGKGKTTAALGIVLRSLGYGKRVLIVQFGKSAFSGEVKALEQFGDQVKLIQGGKGFVGILGDKKLISEHKQAAIESFELLKKEIMSEKWDLVMADEIIGAVSGNILDIKLVLDLLDQKPEFVDLILTGRGASQEIIEKADLVSEIKSIKHPFDKGIKAKRGIDF